jgi:glycosyltransferase involved in cell wall biosynthesis
MIKVSIVLPARNEEQLIGATLSDILKYFKNKNYRYEILVVINGCTDKTVEIVNSHTNKNKNVKIINSKPGYGLALKKGMQSSMGQYVVIFNVDFYDLKLIDLVDIDLYGRDLIMGSKMAHWSEDKRSNLRKMYSLGYNLLLKILFGFKGSDTHGIKVMRKEVINKILKKCKTNSGIMDTEFVIKAQRENFKIADFPVVVDEKREPRFPNRLFSTPVDLYNLYKSLK